MMPFFMRLNLSRILLCFLVVLGPLASVAATAEDSPQAESSFHGETEVTARVAIAFRAVTNALHRPLTRSRIRNEVLTLKSITLFEVLKSSSIVERERCR